MKKIFKKKIIISIGAIIAFSLCLFYLFYDGFCDRRFRTMQDPIASNEQVDLTGLRDIKASGGANVNYGDIKKNLNNIKENVIIVDAMHYFHGYINSVPTTLLGYHVSKPGIRHLLRRIFVTGTFKERRDLVNTEAEEAEKYGLGYKNVKIASKSVPTAETINEFINFYEKLPANTWLHFHCHHGRGRTSILLVMIDIMKNAPTVSLNDIVERQHLLGSSDLFDTEKWLYGTYTTEELVCRKNFIKAFYNFIVQRKAGGIQEWADWFNPQKNDMKEFSNNRG